MDLSVLMELCFRDSAPKTPVHSSVVSSEIFPLERKARRHHEEDQLMEAMILKDLLQIQRKPILEKYFWSTQTNRKFIIAALAFGVKSVTPK